MNRFFASACGALAGLLIAATAHAAYPDKPIHFIVPFPPGGGTDVIARTIAQKLQQSWNAQIIVENRAGADTQIGTLAVARAAPDGYTFGFITPSFAINKSLYPKLPYDPERDFTAVTALALSPFFLVVATDSKARSLKDLIAESQAPNANMSYSGSSSNAQVNEELFRHAAGIQALYVPYKGSAPAVTAVASGEVAFTLDTLLSTKGLIDGGKLRVLAVSSAQRFKDMPDVPTLAEAGMKDFELSFWYGMIAPAATPPELIAKMSEAVGKILQLPDVKKAFATLGSQATPTTPEQFGATLRADMTRYQAVIKAYSLQPSQ